jgi:hypothetical protein
MANKQRLKIEPDPIGEKLLTLREAAGVLRLNPRTLRAYLPMMQLIANAWTPQDPEPALW